VDSLDDLAAANDYPERLRWPQTAANP